MKRTSLSFRSISCHRRKWNVPSLLICTTAASSCFRMLLELELCLERVGAEGFACLGISPNSPQIHNCVDVQLDYTWHKISPATTLHSQYGIRFISSCDSDSEAQVHGDICQIPSLAEHVEHLGLYCTDMKWKTREGLIFFLKRRYACFNIA